MGQSQIQLGQDIYEKSKHTLNDFTQLDYYILCVRIQHQNPPRKLLLYGSPVEQEIKAGIV